MENGTGGTDRSDRVYPPFSNRMAALSRYPGETTDDRQRTTDDRTCLLRLLSGDSAAAAIEERALGGGEGPGVKWGLRSGYG